MSISTESNYTQADINRVPLPTNWDHKNGSLEFQIDMELRHEGEYDKESAYRLYLNDELLLERPYFLPPDVEFQVIHLTIRLNNGGNTFNLIPIKGNLFLGKLNIDRVPIQHTKGYFEIEMA